MTITDIKGLGASSAKKLQKAQIASVDQLVALDEDGVVEAVEKSGIDADKILEWQAKGRDLLGLQDAEAPEVVETQDEDPEPVTDDEPEVEDEAPEVVETQKTEEAPVVTAPTPDVTDDKIRDIPSIEEFMEGEGQKMLEDGHSTRSIIVRGGIRCLGVKSQDVTKYIKDGLSIANTLKKAQADLK